MQNGTSIPLPWHTFSNNCYPRQKNSNTTWALENGHYDIAEKNKGLGIQTSFEHTKKQYKIVNIIKFIHLFCFPKKKIGFVNSESNLSKNF